MTKATTTARTKPANSAAFAIFDVPKFEIPAAFHDLAEKSVSQAKENYEKVKTATGEATDLLGDTYATATKGAADYGIKLLDVYRSNANAAFDFASGLLMVKSLSDAVELTTAHARSQFDAVSAQTRELAGLAQKVAVITAEPIKDGVSKAFKQTV